MKHRTLIKYILISGLIAIFLTGCTIGSPTGKKEAIRRVTDALGYEPEFTNSFSEKSSYNRFKKNYYYEFEDLEGMRFTYSSVIVPEGLDGATFYYYYQDKLNYKRRILPFYSSEIESLCKEYGFGYEKMLGCSPDSPLQYDIFGNEVQYSGSSILINAFTDLDKAADLVVQIQDLCRIRTLKSPVVDADYCNTEISVRVTAGEKNYTISTFKLLNASDYAEHDKIYDKLYKDYVEVSKKYEAIKDIPAEVLNGTNPEILHGVFNGETYPEWNIVLSDDADPDNPQYSFKMKYKEPSERTNYAYNEGYYTKDLTIQNFIAQLGGTCTFHEQGSGDYGAGFDGYLGDDVYEFGFYHGMNTVFINKNGKEYLFKTEVNNPANNTYSFILSKEEIEEIFGINIEYNNAESIFVVNI